MKKRCHLLVCLLCCILCLTGCGQSLNSVSGTPAPASQRFATQFLDTFDTAITFIAYAEDQAAFDRYAALAHAEFQRLHQYYDAYNAYAGVENIHTLNQRAMVEPVAVEEPLYALLAFCRTRQPETHSVVNIAMGSVLSLWHDAREAASANPEAAALPGRQALEAAAQHTGIEDLILDDTHQTVYYADSLLRLDVGAVAKGYATERVAALLREEGLESFLINAGGNVRAGAAPLDPDRLTWAIGIQNPEMEAEDSQAESLVATVYANDLSVVTSGVYQRFYTVDGVRYHHLIDPATLMPGAYYLSASVLTRDSGMADLLSTAAFLLPYDKSLALIESLPGVEAIWVMPDGEIRMTEGAEKLTEKPH